MTQYYRALVGIKSADTGSKKDKASREEYHIQLMHDLLKQWNSVLPVMPYYDKSVNPDLLYQGILRQFHAFRSPNKPNINIDNPKEVLNKLGENTGHVFYSEIPAEDKKQRKRDRAAYEAEKEKYRKQHKKFPPELRDKYEYLIEEPVPAPKTKLYAYSVVNPNGMFNHYDFPIKRVSNISLEDSKLVNRNYGTYHDILLLGDLDFESTHIPTVVFLNDGIMFESNDPMEIRDFLLSHLKRKDYVALIDCEM